MANHQCSSCNQSRRDFLRTGLFGIGVGAALVFEHSALAMSAESFFGGSEAHPERILIVLELSGANDGLNTVVPYRNDVYYKARPTLAIKPEQTLKLNDELGLHSSMRGFKSLWDDGKLAIVPGCGYPNPNRSHFSAMEYWHTAAPYSAESNGWIRRAETKTILREDFVALFFGFEGRLLLPRSQERGANSTLSCLRVLLHILCPRVVVLSPFPITIFRRFLCPID